jgi:hypothetical protein
MIATTNEIKEFFTDSEWDLIFNLLDDARMSIDEDHPYLEETFTALDKIRSLFAED